MDLSKITYKIRILISDLFNKVPAIILIPGILLTALSIAIFFIWAGMKMAPVSLKEPEDPYVSNGNNNNTRNSSVKTSTIQDQNNPDESLNDSGNDYYSQRKTENGYNDSSAEAVNEIQSTNNSEGNNSKDNKNNNQSLIGVSTSGSSTESGDEDLVAAEGSMSSSSSTDSSTVSSTSTSSGCTYPSGSVSTWWKRATQAQKNCYVTKNGQPDFSNPEPYFCDYENNEDCYIR